MNCICLCLLLDWLFSSVDQVFLLPIPYCINHFSFLIDLDNCSKSFPALFLRIVLAVIESIVISRVSTWFYLQSACSLFLFLRRSFLPVASVTLSSFISHHFCSSASVLSSPRLFLCASSFFLSPAFFPSSFPQIMLQ